MYLFISVFILPCFHVVGPLNQERAFVEQSLLSLGPAFGDLEQSRIIHKDAIRLRKYKSTYTNQLTKMGMDAKAAKPVVTIETAKFSCIQMYMDI